MRRVRRSRVTPRDRRSARAAVSDGNVERTEHPLVAKS
jgi:hypothetical protein